MTFEARRERRCAKSCSNTHVLNPLGDGDWSAKPPAVRYRRNVGLRLSMEFATLFGRDVLERVGPAVPGVAD